MPNSICISKQGAHRAVNQDRAGHFYRGDYGLYVVADGMGGHYSGDKASQTVLSAIESWWGTFLSAPQRPGFIQSTEQLRQLLSQCHTEIERITPSGQVCGTTVVLLWLYKEEYALFSAGDSRCYQIRRRWPLPVQFIQLTHDDVVSADAPGGARNAGKLMRALGCGTNGSVTLQTGRLSRGSIFLLCSDGVYKACPPDSLAAIMRQAGSIDLLDIGNQIDQAVEKGGARDDHSMVLVEV